MTTKQVEDMNVLYLKEYDRQSHRGGEEVNIFGSITLDLTTFTGDGKGPQRGDTLEDLTFVFDPVNETLRIDFGYWTDDTRTVPHHYD